MKQNTDTKPDGCVFPIGPDGRVCGRPVAVNGKPGVGRRPLYCDDPDHTREKKFAACRRYKPASTGGNHDEVTQVESAVWEHPVTDGRVSFAALLTRFEESSTQLATVLNRAIEVARTVSDPDAASYEVQQRQREAAIQVAEAHSAQAAAERDANNARKQAAHEAEQRAQADEAAEHALREVQQMHTELTKAHTAATHTEAEKQAAQQTAEHHRATIQSLRQQLQQQHHDHRHDIDTLRQQAHEERTELAKHYTNQLATMLATIQQTNDQTQPTTTTPKTQRNTRKI